MLRKYKVFIFSQTPDELVNFYTDVLKFKLKNELKLEKDYGYNVLANESYEIWIAKHSKVEGFNKDPYRHIITFYVDNLKPWYKKIKASKKVKIVQKPIFMSEFNPDEKRRVFTILDPEGNCLQFIGES